MRRQEGRKKRAPLWAASIPGSCSCLRASAGEDCDRIRRTMPSEDVDGKFGDSPVSSSPHEKAAANSLSFLLVIASGVHQICPPVSGKR